MNIEIEKESRSGAYLMNILVHDGERHLRVFLNCYDWYEEDSEFIHLFKLCNEEFLNDNNIEYIKEDDNNIIPIGVVDFQRLDIKKYCEDRLCCLVFKNDELYKCNKMIENLIKAITIKYESVKFSNGFKEYNVEKYEL